MQKIYELKNASKIYFSKEDVVALKKVNLEINKGEVIIILGPSGSGKSTLLNILSGIDHATEGEVLFSGNDLNKFSEEELTDYRRENLGFIFQSYNLVSNLTVKENIELGMNKKTDMDLDEILNILELGKEKNKFPYQLSGGQMQRVAIARAIIKNPKVIFCDEPTGALDEKIGKKVLVSLQEINQKYGTTIIIVTHNPSISKMGNVVIRMNSGEIVEVSKNDVVEDANNLRWA